MRASNCGRASLLSELGLQAQASVAAARGLSSCDWPALGYVGFRGSAVVASQALERAAKPYIVNSL